MPAPDGSPRDDLPRVDPTGPLSPLLSGYARVLRTRPGRWSAIHVAPKIDPVLLRASRGRLSSGIVLPTALLTTTGARSGQPRVNPVLYFHDGDEVIIVASSYGREKHPAWLHNLRAHPRVQLAKTGDGRARTAVEVTDQVERDRLWPLADRVYPLFADYRVRAAQVGREIPLVRLSAPIDGPLG